MRTTRSGAIRLFSGPLSMFGAKAQIAVLEKGLDFELVMVPFEAAYEPKHPEVLRINPKRQVPVLIHGDLEIFDSTLSDAERAELSALAHPGGRRFDPAGMAPRWD